VTRHGIVLHVEARGDTQRVTVRFDDGTTTTVSTSTMFTIEPGSELTATGFSAQHQVFHWESRRADVPDELLANDE
jgi:hypothetical protein